jgi:hypothetical protein
VVEFAVVGWDLAAGVLAVSLEDLDGSAGGTCEGALFADLYEAAGGPVVDDAFDERPAQERGELTRRDHLPRTQLADHVTGGGFEGVEIYEHTH